MGDNKDGIWFDDLFSESKLSGTEKLWRDINRIADRSLLMVKFNRYPLVVAIPQYKITIYKIKKNNLYMLFEESGMELEPLLKKIKKKVENYYNEHKEYLVQKPGGGEMV